MKNLAHVTDQQGGKDYFFKKKEKKWKNEIIKKEDRNLFIKNDLIAHAGEEYLDQ